MNWLREKASNRTQVWSFFLPHWFQVKARVIFSENGYIRCNAATFLITSSTWLQNRGIRAQLGLLQYKLETRCFLFIMTMAKKIGCSDAVFPTLNFLHQDIRISSATKSQKPTPQYRWPLLFGLIEANRPRSVQLNLFEECNKWICLQTVFYFTQLHAFEYCFANSTFLFLLLV